MIEDFTPNNFRDYLSHKRFHHQDKGCRMTLYRSKSHKVQDENISIQSYCHTHSTQCSKSGWELGWFGGTNSRKMWKQSRYELKALQCKICGVYFLLKNWALYCSDCGVKMGSFRQSLYKNKSLEEYSDNILKANITRLEERKKIYRKKNLWHKIGEMNRYILIIQKELNKRKYKNP